MEQMGKKHLTIQLNATYFSALGENKPKLLLVRAIQMFIPGILQICCLDIFAANDYKEKLVKTVLKINTSLRLKI
jgi:sucrose phosphorylase